MDAAEEKDLPEEEKMLQEEREETEGVFHPNTPHKGASRHRGHDTAERGISPKQV